MVIQHGELRAGIVVDKLLGEFQTVIKPLGQLFQRRQGHRRLHHPGHRARWP